MRRSQFLAAPLLLTPLAAATQAKGATVTDLPLTKISETENTVTVGWTPPAGVEWYTLFAGGKRVSNHSPDGYRQARFNKQPEPQQVVATIQTSPGVFDVAVGTYPPVAPPPPPLPPPGQYVTTQDFRASAHTSINYATGQTVPPDMYVLMASNDDIKLVTDSRFPTWQNKAWKVRLNYHSKNPFWTTQEEVSNSAEIIGPAPKRPIAENQIDWYAQSIFIDRYLKSDSNWWMLFSQLGYPTIWSPPGAFVFVGPRHWANTIGADQFVFMHAAGTNPSVGSGTDYGNRSEPCRPMSEVIGRRMDICAGVKWNLGYTGWWFVETRLDGGTWKTHVDLKNIPTIERVATASYPPPWPVVDKQGGYMLADLSWPGWKQGTAEEGYFLRGLSRHPARADAEASLG